MKITETTTVAEIAAALPESIRVFERYGVDFCCRGRRSIGEVCRAHGLSMKELTGAIDASTAEAASEQRDWMHEPLSPLAEHIVATYHTALRDELPRLMEMASKVTAAHGSKADYVGRIERVVGELSADLNSHMQKEERILFPAIRQLESGGRSHAAWIPAPITVMEHEHDRAGELLAELRRLTDGYTVSDWGCATVRALYQRLAALEASTHVLCILKTTSSSRARWRSPRRPPSPDRRDSSGNGHAACCRENTAPTASSRFH